MGAAFRLFQLVDGAPGYYLPAVVDEVVDGLPKRKHLRPIVDDGQVDDAEGRLHLGLLVELVQYHLRVLVPFQFHDNAHAVPVRLVAQIGDPLDLLFPHQFRNLFNKLRLVHLVGDLGDNYRLALVLFLGLDKGPGTHLDDAAAGPVGLQYPLPAVDEAAGREIRSGN